MTIRSLHFFVSIDLSDSCDHANDRTSGREPGTVLALSARRYDKVNDQIFDRRNPGPFSWLHPSEGASTDVASFYRMLVERAFDLILVVNAQDRVAFCNHAAAHVLGFLPDGLIGQSVFDVIHADDQERVRGVLRQFAAAAPFPFRMRHADGGVRLVECHITRALDPSGARVSVLVARDVTVDREQESDRRRNARVETLGRMAAEVAHDVNNLLHAMTLHVELLDDELAAGAMPSTEPLKRALETAGDLTTQLLAYTRGGSPVQEAPDARRCDAHALINRSRMLLRTLARRSSRLAFALDAMSATIAVSPNELMQILVNVVANARDAMPDGGRLAITTRNVTAGCDGDRERFPLGALAIEVSDTGVGMPPEVKRRIFEPFFTTKAADQGTGLGLATVKTIVERAGGCIEVDSMPGAGTTIRIVLPPAAHTSMLDGVSAA